MAEIELQEVINTLYEGEVALEGGKVDKTTEANKVYGTDATGAQKLYIGTDFGKVDSVDSISPDASKNVTLKYDIPTVPAPYYVTPYLKDTLVFVAKVTAQGNCPSNQVNTWNTNVTSLGLTGEPSDYTCVCHDTSSGYFMGAFSWMNTLINMKTRVGFNANTSDTKFIDVEIFRRYKSLPGTPVVMMNTVPKKIQLTGFVTAQVSDMYLVVRDYEVEIYVKLAKGDTQSDTVVGTNIIPTVYRPQVASIFNFGQCGNNTSTSMYNYFRITTDGTCAVRTANIGVETNYYQVFRYFIGY